MLLVVVLDILTTNNLDFCTVKGKWEEFLSEETNRLKKMGVVDFKKKMDDSIKREEEKFRDSGYKYLSIANPAHGEDFFSLIFKKDWNDKTMVTITRDKLYSLCTAKITNERCVLYLNLVVLNMLNYLFISFNYVDAKNCCK